MLSTFPTIPAPAAAPTAAERHIFGDFLLDELDTLRASAAVLLGVEDAELFAAVELQVELIDRLEDELAEHASLADAREYQFADILTRVHQLQLVTDAVARRAEILACQ